MPKRESGYRRGEIVQPDKYPLGGAISQVYVTCKGRKFGAWIDADSRNQGYNAGNPIENPVFIVESILRDILGLGSSVINYASIDALGDATSGRRDNWLFARSLTQQQNSLAVIDEICHEAAIVSIHDYANQERLVALDHYNPTNQLANADIVQISGEPPQVRVRQTHVKYIRNEFFLNYKLNYATGNYDKQLYITASATNMSSNTRADKTYASYTALCNGSQTMYNKTERWTFDSNWIRDNATAELFIKQMADWLAIRKWEIDATLWYSAKTLKLEAFDQVTWNLDLLPISMRDVQISNLAATPYTSGGSLADGTYYYVITGVDPHGEGKKSNEISAVITGGGGNGRVVLTWTALPDVTAYRIYRGISSGGQDRYYEIAPAATYTDTGASATTGTPPAAANAFFITNIIDYGLRGGGKVGMKFMLCPYIYF